MKRSSLERRPTNGSTAPARRAAGSHPRLEATESRPAPSLQRARRLGPSLATVRNAVQRAVDLAQMNATENDRYYVDPAHTNVLYSQAGAAPPKPKGLYGSRSEVATDHTPLRKWQPNTRLVARNEANRGFDAGQLAGWVETLFGNVAPENQPELGILGVNDCDAFAGQLQLLIAEERARYAQDSAGEDKYDDVRNIEPIIEIGDKMRHIFHGKQACGHHGATVVAEDGESLVTLEAHVSKRDLQAPEFHIRKGVGGFVEDNDTDQLGQSRGLGGEVGIQRLDDLTQEDVQEGLRGLGASERRFRRITGEERVPMGGDQYYPPESFVTSGLAVTREPARKKALAMIRRTLERDEWSEQGEGLFTTKVPGGVSKMRRIVASNKTAGEKLTALQQEAQKRWDSPDLDRKIATLDLYHTVRQVDPGNPDFANLTRRLNRVEGRL